MTMRQATDDDLPEPRIGDQTSLIDAHPNLQEDTGVNVAWFWVMSRVMREGLLVLTRDGTVVEANQSFTDTVGYDLADGPWQPPYPWWPTEAEDATARARNESFLAEALSGTKTGGELLFFTTERKKVWVEIDVFHAAHPQTGEARVLALMRDVTRERDARQRRAWAAQISTDLVAAADIDTVLGVAEHGFGVLFDGGSTVQLNIGEEQPVALRDGTVVDLADLPESIREGLVGVRNADATHARPGILLVPNSAKSVCRVWVQFPRPRRIRPDEMIVADLLAQAFSLAVDRVLAEQMSAHREANLGQAIESHRLVGQAVGILVERYRIGTAAAFERLRQASQNRNIKLREVARRVVEQGIDPESI